MPRRAAAEAAAWPWLCVCVTAATAWRAAARAPRLRMVCCLRRAREQRQPRRSADGALMWVLPCAWSYARACTRPCFLSSVFFSCGFVPAGDEFAEACAERVIGLDDVSHGRITPDSQGRTSIEQRGGKAKAGAPRHCTRRQRSAGSIAHARAALRYVRKAVAQSRPCQIAVLLIPRGSPKRATSR